MPALDLLGAGIATTSVAVAMFIASLWVCCTRPPFKKYQILGHLWRADWQLLGKLSAIGLPIVAIYVLSDFGSVLGGGLSSWLLARGKTINTARKIAMLICATCAVPIVFAYRAENTWTAVLLIGLAAAAHQGFSTNLLTLPSDMFPAQAVASVVGLGGTAGALGGMMIAKVVGYILQSTGSYMLPFFIAGGAYLVALCFLHLLAPRIEAVTLKQV